MSKHHLVSLCLLALAAAAGCGQSGPLYLPGDPSAVETRTTITAPAGGEEEEDSDDEGR